MRFIARCNCIYLYQACCDNMLDINKYNCIVVTLQWTRFFALAVEKIAKTSLPSKNDVTTSFCTGFKFV